MSTSSGIRTWLSSAPYPAVQQAMPHDASAREFGEALQSAGSKTKHAFSGRFTGGVLPPAPAKLPQRLSLGSQWAQWPGHRLLWSKLSQKAKQHENSARWPFFCRFTTNNPAQITCSSASSLVVLISQVSDASVFPCAKQQATYKGVSFSKVCTHGHSTHMGTAASEVTQHLQRGSLPTWHRVSC